MATLILDDFIPYRLSYTSNLVSELIADSYSALFGLTIPEWRIVAVVAEAAGVNQHTIGRRTRMDKVTVSRAVIGLAHRGLIERRPSPVDRRSQLLSLSTAGVSLHRQVAPKALELERRIFASFDGARLAEFVRSLRAIDDAVLSVMDTA